MLHGQQRQAEAIGHGRCVVARMQVTGHARGGILEQRLHEGDGILEGKHSAQVRHIADVGRRIEEAVACKAERVLEFAADAKDLPLFCPAHEEGQRREAAAAADHVGFPLKPVHDGIVGAQADAAIVREDDVT